MSDKKMTYAAAFTELESILQQIESNDLNVDILASQVKRASELIKYCRGKLHETEKEIEKVIEEMGDE